MKKEINKKILPVGGVLLVVILILICVIVRCSGEKKNLGIDTESNLGSNAGIEIDQTEDGDLESDESDTTVMGDEIDYGTAFDGEDDTTQDDTKDGESGGSEGDDKKEEPADKEDDGKNDNSGVADSNEDDNFDVSETAPGEFGGLF